LVFLRFLYKILNYLKKYGVFSIVIRLVILVVVIILIYNLFCFYACKIESKSDIYIIDINNNRPNKFEPIIFNNNKSLFISNIFGYFYFLKFLFFSVWILIVTCVVKLMQVFWITRQLVNSLTFFFDTQYFFLNKDVFGGFFYWDIHYLNKYGIFFESNTINSNRVWETRFHIFGDICNIQSDLNFQCKKLISVLTVLGFSFKILNYINDHIDLINML